MLIESAIAHPLRYRLIDLIRDDFRMRDVRIRA
jgi:hypothetical protein